MVGDGSLGYPAHAAYAGIVVAAGAPAVPRPLLSQLANAGRPALQAAGFDIVYDSSYPLGTQDLAPVISAAKDAGPDSFVAFSYPPDTFALTEQARISNLDVGAFYVGVATAFPAFLGKFGAAAEGILGAGGVNPDTAEMQAYRKQHVEVTGAEADYWASPVMYASLEILEAAVERGECTVMISAEPPPLLLRQAASLDLPLEEAVADERLVLLELDPRVATAVRIHGGTALVQAIREEVSDKKR